MTAAFDPSADSLPLALYIHIPWCVKKCPYCDFNSHAQREELPIDAYIAALLADLDADVARFSDALKSATAARRPLVSIFFGGGTPSLFPPAAIGRILDGVAARIPIAADTEITLETNPGTVEHGRFDEYLLAGINRISFGVQSFDDDKLRRLGRIHTAAEAVRAIGTAQDSGYANINLDLMYALPLQSLDGALADLERAIALAPTHISHYQLTLEPNTLFASRPPPLPDEDSAWDMQEHGQRLLADAGYEQYEVSGYARDGRYCVHNLNYWQFGDYLGIGAGAHGKISSADAASITRTTKVMLPRGYLERAERGIGFGKDAVVEMDQRPFEFMLNALRLNEGVPSALFEQRTGVSLQAIGDICAKARKRGWLDADPDYLRPTSGGQRFLNDLIGSFLVE